MSDIEDMQGRIVAAMQRIEAGLEGLGPVSDTPDPGLAEALEDERTANAQLQERVRTLTEKAEADMEVLKKEIEAQSLAMARLDMDLQRLRQANTQLRESNAALRDANEEALARRT